MANIKWIGCAERNFRISRPAPYVVEAIVIHIIDGPQSAADSTFLDNTLTNPRSAHYSVGRDGTVHQYVHDDDTAFHAGVVLNPSWPQMKKTASGGFVNPNFYSIGIEHDGKPNDEWTESMYAATSTLLQRFSERYEKLKTLSLDNVVMHRQIRSDKSCPGFKVDMKRLIAGASATPPDNPVNLLVKTIVDANVRIGSPSTSAPVARVMPADSLLHVNGEVQGETVVRRRDNKAISKWFSTVDGEFVWAGATDQA